MTRGLGAEPGIASTPSIEPAPATAAPAEGELAFVVNDFDFGNALSDAERQRVDASLEPWRGRSVTLSELRMLRDELTALLYNGGDSLVRVVLPPQTVSGGIVHFDIERGHVESVAVENGSPVSTRQLGGILETTSGTAPSLREIERNMRIVEGVPGVGGVSAALAPGTEPGGTIVNVDVTPADRFYAAATIDNAGSKYAGWRRLGFSGGVNNLLGLGDQLQATAFVTPRVMQTRAGEDGRTRLGRVSYDLLTGLGASRAGIAYSHVSYRLGGDFSGLGTGNADVATLYGTYPTIRTADASLDIGASLEAWHSTDERFDHILENQQHSLIASLRADGTISGHWGENRTFTQYSVVASRGTAKLKELDSGTGSQLADSSRFNFFKLEPSATYAQSITPTSQVTLAVRGQLASRALDGSQQLGLGGPSAVRAYDQNAAAVDGGIIGSVTASQFFRALPGASVQAFFDCAYGRSRGVGGLPGASVHLQGYGVGASYSRKHVAMQISYAMRAGAPLENTARQQTWVSLTTMF